MHLRLMADLSYFEVVVISLFYQFALYAAIRLAHHGFTLGELGLVCFGATILFMEMVNLTIAKVRDFKCQLFALLTDSYRIALACNDAVYQNIPSTNTTPNISHCSYTRLASYWSIAFSSTISIKTHRPASCSPPTLP